MNADLPLGMEQMNLVFDVVDELEISRERIQVELLPADDGRVERLANGRLGITLPATRPFDEWLPDLRGRLSELRQEADAA